MRRRDLLAGASALLAAGGLPARAAAALPRELRLGFQKSGLFVSARQRGVYEAHFRPLGVPVRWVEFQFGPPMLEALNLGAIDFATVGNAPPIFAQAASGNLLYVAAQEAGGEAVIVPEGSGLRSLADLRGRTVGVPKGSSAHATLVAAVEKGGLGWGDINPVYLAPADGVAAFARGAIDAWSIWDPYLAIAEGKGARVLAHNHEVANPHSFYLANRAFAETYPEVVGQIADVLAREAAWAEANRDAYARTLHEAQGIQLEVEAAIVARTRFRIKPIDEAVLDGQQATADRFHRLGLIPRAIRVRDIAWAWIPKA
ncbi:aliphatic sulfonates family ABC transporter, periplsmic ligand-binding protein [Methylobacterium sp. 4-46]|uniref:aliphatic sulfonate ABC transporter substrate-binding protein n=1 Tax=unclassified Methylobacterium TaxID=2615210 RepID=UPI000152CC16|nr:MULTISPECIES: aliphatic sulfonate ABC transporter substrate-binding protein [Methylobacterium]ACA19783.1 aliphatic sulfonates family ABC transporter, periplsmic ligand-binding protein [Methylobacterium sp. 4-46]WFT78970.1 aliphatic sulfonate ABC transporter substrate-binding protein [Methylobacterium nodulans]